MSSDALPVLGLDGREVARVPAPAVFSRPVHAALIRRAVLAVQSAKKQPQGVKPKAGRDNTARARSLRALPLMQRTINTDRARLPRLKNRRGLLAGRVASVPQAVGGPVPHPPKPWAVRRERINKKEKRAALASAIAATARPELVRRRHVLGERALPLVVESAFERLEKTRRVVDALKALGVYEDVAYARARRRVRAGKGKMRGRKHKQKKSLLIVTASNAPVYRAARNLPGVEVVPVTELDIAKLAPGAEPGRLTLWSANALKALEAMSA